ncbi:nascent polypeptide-associated complex protein [Thermococcus chitonophagus]|uniref:Nascent polypeptide-associated complex protein n=1 Tax=Thermococcus chitonophagus TaxID=54262 RepID=A0A160VX06_9EURY|nr:nascent polypeptide-associated complex protein [Thermococcus chitonophagus]ASJ16473.1 nascent polypeptide-associated complex protein [Thermococcus chitonophagus]CUX78531.1 Nascent polypeptide-associated complex protein [Thermococcus chitonophagus]
MMPMNPKQLKKLMKQLDMRQLDGVVEVVIRMEDKEIVIKEPVVTVIKAMGEKMYQIAGGQEEERVTLKISEDDIKLVMEQAGVDYETAKKALEETGGDLAEAILRLTEQ